MSAKSDIDLMHCRRVSHPSDWIGTENYIGQQLLVLLIKGRLAGHVNGQEFDLVPGSLLWIGPGNNRRIWAQPGSGQLINWRLRFQVTCDNTVPTFVRTHRLKTGCDSLISSFEDISSLSTSQTKLQRLALKARLADLVTRLEMIPESTDTRFRTFTQREQSIIMETLSQSMYRNVSALDLAKKLRLTSDYVTRVCKATYGVSPRSLIMRERIRNAAELFSDTTLSLKEFCDSIEEPDVSRFCRQFKQVIGCTPTQYRQRVRGTTL